VSRSHAGSSKLTSWHVITATNQLPNPHPHSTLDYTAGQWIHWVHSVTAVCLGNLTPRQGSHLTDRCIFLHCTRTEGYDPWPVNDYAYKRSKLHWAQLSEHWTSSLHVHTWYACIHSCFLKSLDSNTAALSRQLSELCAYLICILAE